MYFTLKVLIAALVMAGVTELASRHTLIAALLASLPLTTILAFSWIYYENRDANTIITLSYSMLWLILPSSLIFVLLPAFLKAGMKFELALPLSCVIMAAVYPFVLWLQKIVSTHHA